MSIRIGVDTGGTFTDVVLYDEATGEVHVTKTPSTPGNFDEGVLTGVEKILDGFDSADVSFVSHGTTVGTNAVLEDELPNLGLLANDGLRDVIEIGDQRRPEIFNFQVDKPPELIERYLRREIPGRIDAGGDVIEPLSENAVKEEVEFLADQDVESVVVSLLFSYLNSEHEQRVGDLIAEHTDLDYTLTSDVHPETREYERVVTTVLNEGIKIVIRDYIERLNGGLRDLDINVPVNVIHSGGGVFASRQAVEKAVRTLYSGPAGGAVAANHVCRQEGIENAIGLDMGGTSTDVSTIREGDIVRANQAKINNLPIQTRVIDIQTVGAGGGSIAWIDDGGALHVGPQSAGADPGPICYSQGGTQPTVTDANLLLGRLNPENFLGGDMELDIGEPKRIIRETLGGELGQSVEEAALSVVKVANSSLARQIRQVTVERGDDPEEFSLVAFGGAGPLQAPMVAKDMNMDTVVIPRSPGVFSARGLLIADVRMDEVHSYRGDTTDPAVVTDQFEELEAQLLDRFDHQQIDREDVEINRAADIRYEGQSYELTIPISSGELDQETINDVIDRFHDEHERLYGHVRRERQIEIVTLRVTGVVPTSGMGGASRPGAESANRGTRNVYHEGLGVQETDVYNRTGLSPSDIVEGPAILEEPQATTLVPSDTTATVSEFGNVIIDL